jgi:poly-gamma-glutamate synthesis protein (capsule biosynthesis protein)
MRGRAVALLGLCLVTACASVDVSAVRSGMTPPDRHTGAIAATPSPITPTAPPPTTLPTPPTLPPSTTHPPPPTTTLPPTTTVVAAPRRITIAFTGDTLVHSPLWRRAASNAGGEGFDFAPMLDRLRPVLDATDLAVCHLETPIAPAGEALSTAPIYGVPAEIADAIAAAGYERCSTASNHSWDRGAAGIDRTVAVLEVVGVEQSGMARTPDEIAPRVFDVGGVAVTHLSYTFSFNGIRPAAGEEWRSTLIDPFRIVDDAIAARRLGAQVVVVSLHWGVEGSPVPSEWQRRIAEGITASGAIDLIVGHHAHVLQPIEQINGTWVMFGLGNILSNLPTEGRWPAGTQDGAVAIVEFTVAEGGPVEVAAPVLHPTWVDKEAGWVVRVVATDLAGTAIDETTRRRLEDSLVRTRSVVGDFLAP